MRKAILGALSAAALMPAVVAQAQIVTWEITPEQERGIYTTIYPDRGTVGVAPAPEYDVSVGAIVPADIDLYEMPASVTYAPARQYRYVTHGNRVIFVEPGTRRVIHVIGP